MSHTRLQRATCAALFEVTAALVRRLVGEAADIAVEGVGDGHAGGEAKDCGEGDGESHDGGLVRLVGTRLLGELYGLMGFLHVGLLLFCRVWAMAQ